MANHCWKNHDCASQISEEKAKESERTKRIAEAT